MPCAYHLRLAIGVLLAPISVVMAEQPDAATLVREVRKREAWIERVDSLQIKAVQEW
jgi:hypothetical protein